MAKTKVILQPQAQQKIQEGVETLYKAVSTTLGPTGRNVAIAYSDRYGRIFSHQTLHDGVRIADSINLEDEAVNMGAAILLQSAKKQVGEVGDGTTLVITLGYALYTEARKNIIAGQNPMLLRKGIENGIKKLTATLKKLGRPIKTEEQKLQIATVSSEDPQLGKIVVETLTGIGIDGLVSVEPSSGKDTFTELQEGMQFDKGFASPFFITNTRRQEAVLQDPFILVTDLSIIDLTKLKLILENIARLGKKLLIFTPNIGDASLAALVNNKRQGTLPCLVIKAPGVPGLNQKAVLNDIAVFTGASFISEDLNDTLSLVRMEDLGQVEYVTATKTDSLLVGGKGDPQQIADRVNSIRRSIELEKTDFDREKLKERLAKLTSGVAVIKVGGVTEIEMLERVERVKDAVAATKAAITSGIVPGGEVVFLQVREELDKSILAEKILYDALSLPFNKLIEHAGLDPRTVAVDLYQCKLEDPLMADNYGIDVTTGEAKDMIKAGIIDPLQVATSALTNASSVAIQLFCTEALVIPIKDDNIMQIGGI